MAAKFSVSLPVLHCSEFQDPNVRGASVHTLYIRAADLPDCLSNHQAMDKQLPDLTAGNPRPDWHKSPVRKPILATFQSSPDIAPGHAMNRGLVLLAHSLSYKLLSVEITFDKEKVAQGRQALIDGLTTGGVLGGNRETLHPAQLLKLEVYTGYDATGTAIALSRNSSKQLKLNTTKSFTGLCDSLQELTQKVGLKTISFREGDGGSIDVAILIQHLGLAHPTLSPEDEISGCRFYSSHEAAFKSIAKFPHNFNQFTPDTVKQLLQLSDSIQILFQPRAKEKVTILDPKGKEAKMFFPQDKNEPKIIALGKGFQFPLLQAICHHNKLGTQLIKNEVVFKAPFTEALKFLEENRKKVRKFIMGEKMNSDTFGKDFSQWLSIKAILKFK